MTVNELIEALTSELEAGTISEDSEIRIADQPNWPLEYSTGEYYAILDGNFYIAESEQIGYLPSEVKEQINW